MINAYTVMMASVLIAAPLTKNSINGRRKFVTFATIAMGTLLCLRDAFTIGNDVLSYYTNFINIGSWNDIISSFRINNNFLFSVWMKLIHDITGCNYQFFLSISSLFVIVVFGRFIYRNSRNPLVSVIMYWGLLLYVDMFTIQKQAIAMSILLIAYDALLERRPGKYVLLIMLASLFHFPAIILLPFYWINKVIRADKGYLFFLVCLLVVVYIFRSKIVAIMLDTYETDIKESLTEFLGTKVIIMIGIVLLALVFMPRLRRNKEYEMLLKMLGIAVCLQTFAFYNNTFERLANYFFQYSVLLIPMIVDENCCEIIGNVVNARSVVYIKKMITVVICCYGIWRCANYFPNNSSLYLPFVFFWQK